MSRVIIRSQEADRDLETIAANFDRRSETLSDRFLESVTQGLRQLSRMPGLGAKVESLAVDLDGLRCAPVPNFRNYLIFYRYDDDRVDVTRDIGTLLGDFE